MLTLFVSCAGLSPAFAQQGGGGLPEAPLVKEGEGPFEQLIIRGVTLVNGTGAPPTGPVDVVVEGNKIVSIRTVGYPGVPIDESRRPELAPNGHEIDANGMYLLPGFVDTHAHIGGRNKGSDAEYVFKLWLAHGITTIREPGSMNGLDWVLRHKKWSETNQITAPRIKAYTVLGQGAEKPVVDAESAREWVRLNAKRGADGIKFFGASPAIMFAAADENKKLGLRAATHHAQTDVARWNAINSAKAGITSLEHWYGLPEALFTESTIQDYPLTYNYQNEQNRFEEAGNLWQQAAAPKSDKWYQVMDQLIDLDFTLSPTFTIYEANRDLMKARRAEWHDEYTTPGLWQFFSPSRRSHGSYWIAWGTEQETQWKHNYKLWMEFVNDYKNRGGRVTVGSDAGFIYKVYGFAYIQELELLREAGFHPLEVIRSATLNGAELLGMEDEIGSVEVGKLADFVIVNENPLENLQVLYGTGAIRVNEANEVVRTTGIVYTIKDGVVYDAKRLLEDVRKMVSESKAAGEGALLQPGIYHHSEVK